MVNVREEWNGPKRAMHASAIRSVRWQRGCARGCQFQHLNESQVDVDYDKDHSQDVVSVVHQIPPVDGEGQECCTGATSRRPIPEQSEWVRIARSARGSIPEQGHCSSLATSPLRVAHAHPSWSLRDTLPARRFHGARSLSRHTGERPLPCPLAAGSSLHSTGWMSIGIVVKPPDESFHRLDRDRSFQLPMRYRTDPQ